VVPTEDAAPAADGQDDGAAAAAPQGEGAGEEGGALFTRRQSSGSGSGSRSREPSLAGSDGDSLSGGSSVAAAAPPLQLVDADDNGPGPGPGPSNDGASQGSALHVSKAAVDAPDLEADPFSTPSAHAPAASTSAGEEGEGAAVADDASWVSSGLGSSSHAAAAADQPLLPPTDAHYDNGAAADAPAAPASGAGAGAVDAAWSVLTGASRSAEDEAWEPSLPGTDPVTGEVRLASAFI
jgi:hypothetical protein